MRPWRGPYTYEGAIAHIREKQKTRRSLYIETGWAATKLSIHDEEVVLSWYVNDILGYAPEGIYNLIPEDGYCSPGVIRRIRDYSPTSAWENLLVRRRHLVRQIGSTGSKITRCRTCHGYTWQGAEVESILFKVTGGEAELARHGPHTWYQQYPQYWMDRTLLRHYQPCKKCGGVGRFDYGAKPIYEPVKVGEFLWRAK